MTSMVPIMLPTTLPDEIYLTIFEFLDPGKLMELCCTNKYMHNLADTPVCWQYRDCKGNLRVAMENKYFELCKFVVECEHPPEKDWIIMAMTAGYTEFLEYIFTKYNIDPANSLTDYMELAAIAKAPVSVFKLLMEKYNIPIQYSLNDVYNISVRVLNLPVLYWLADEIDHNENHCMLNMFRCAVREKSLDSVKYVMEKYGKTHVHIDLWIVASSGTVDILDYMFGLGYHFNTDEIDPHSDIRLPIEIACYNKGADMFNYLLEKGFELPVDSDKFVKLVIRARNLEVLELLVYRMGFTLPHDALITAFDNGDTGIINLVYKLTPDKTIKPQHLLLAVNANNLTVAKKLMNDYPDFQQHKQDMLAAACNECSLVDLPMIKWLIEEVGADPKVNDSDVLVAASQYSSRTIISYLLQQGCDPKINSKDIVTFHAAANAEEHSMDLLVAAGLDPYADDCVGFYTALVNANVPVLEWYHSNLKDSKSQATVALDFKKCVELAVKSGKIKMMLYLERFGIDYLKDGILAMAGTLRKKELATWLANRGLNKRNAYRLANEVAAHHNVPLPPWVAELLNT